MNNLFQNIQFDKTYHTYSLNGENLTSATRTINNLKPPFDAKYWSERKAKERGVPPAVIRQEWDQKREASRQKGEQVHAHIEKILRGQTEFDPYLDLNDTLPEIQAFNDYWSIVRGGISAEQVEWVVGDAALKIAGTLDALLFSNVTEQYHVWDWKTNSRFKQSNRFQTLKPPFDDLDDCELAVYSLQSSLYRLIVERNTDLNVGDSYIVHLAASGAYTIHKALDLRERLSDWLSTQ